MSLLVPGVESPGAQGPVLTSQELTALGRLGLTVFERGHLRAAQALAEEGIETARSGARVARPSATLADAVLAMVHVERQQLTEAGRSLDAGGPPGDGPDPMRAALHLAGARLLLATGRPGEARSVLQGLREWRRPLPVELLPWRALVETELDVVSGRPGAVLERARSLLGATGAAPDRVRVLTARAELARGDLAAAGCIVAGVRAGSRNPVACAESWLVTAVVADRRRDDQQALRAVDEALALAEPENLRRPFLASGRPVESMLRRRRRRTPDQAAFVESLLDELDGSHGTVLARPAVGGLLTDRERMVLRHMATLQTNNDIAVDLCISVNTVKAHAKSVFRKLAVAKRRDAVERARELGLI